jgi:hypothetical protein
MSAFRRIPANSKLSPELASLYAANPAKFQRLLAYLIVPRFKLHRLHIDDVSHSAYIDMIGDVVVFKNDKQKFPTLHDWYNHVRGTHHTRKDLSIFDHIRLSKRVTVASLFGIAEKKEIAEFRDMKFRSMGLYSYVYRQIRAKQLTLSWSRDYSFDVTWKDRHYIIQYTHTKDEAGNMGLDLLDAYETNQLSHVYWKDESGEVWALTENPREETIDQPTPTPTPTPTQSTTPPVNHTEVETSIRLGQTEENVGWLLHNLQATMTTVQHMSGECEKFRADIQQLTAQNEQMKTDNEVLKNMILHQRAALLHLLGNMRPSNPNVFGGGPLVLPLQ